MPYLDTLNYYYYGNNLGYTDSTALNPIGLGTLDFTQSPRAFTPVPTPAAYNESYFVSQPESSGAPDDQ